MKAFLYGSIIALFSTFLFSSCQQEVDPNTPNGITDDGIRLEKMIWIDTSLAPGIDTSGYIQFTFDGQKRLSLVSETHFFSGTHNIEVTSTETFVYQGSDTLPVKRVMVDNYSNGDVYTDTSFLFYNASKQIIRDSTVSYFGTGGVSRRNIVYSAVGTNRYRTDIAHYDFGGALLFTDTIRTLRTISGNNLVSQVDSAHTVGTPAFEEIRITNVFDSKNNPARRISLPYMVFPYFNSSGIAQAQAGWEAVSFNNMTNSNFTHISAGGTFNETSTQIYVYGSNNYPLVIKGTFSSGTFPIKTFLFYRTL